MMVTGTLHLVEGRGFDSNMYVVDDGNGKLTIVDTGHDEKREYLIEYIKKMGRDPANIENVILTHVHVDHSGGLAWLVDTYGPRVHVCDIEADAIEKGDLSLTLAGMFKGRMDKLHVDQRLHHGDVITIGDYHFKVLVTPGHTKGSICLHDEATRILVSGDTAFPDGSFGRVDFPSGSATALQQSLEMLAGLDVDILLPGHMGAVTSGAASHLALSARYAKGAWL